MTDIALSNGNGTLIRHADIVSRHAAPRLVDVWLPPSLATGTRLPVIYMHDGQNLFDPAISFASEDWGIPAAMAQVMAETGLLGAIVVGIWNTPTRRRDYAPEKPFAAIRDTQEYDAFIDRAEGTPQSDGYLRFVVEELKPLIDATYPTLPERQHTSTMGSSMGGLISLYALEQYPAVFGAAGCVSTHWIAGGNPLVDVMGAALPPAGGHKLYFDFGTEGLDEHYEPLQRRMDGYLAAAGYTEGADWLTLKFPGADHSERSWRERVHLPLRFLLDRGQQN